MFRKITMLGMMLMLIYLGGWSLMRSSFNAKENQSLEIYTQSDSFFPGLGILLVFTPYLIAGVIFALFILSWWQKHCRKAAITTAFTLSIFWALQTLNLVTFVSTLGSRNLELAQELWLPTITLWILCWLYLRSNTQAVLLPKINGSIWFVRFSMVLVILQVILGSFVSYFHACNSCPNFPTCNGQWLPEADYLGILNLFLSESVNNKQAVLTALNLSHRALALVLFVVLNALMLLCLSCKYPKTIRKAGLWLGLLLFVEVALGVVGSLYGISMPIAVAHTVFAALLMLPLIAISFYSRYSISEFATTELQPKPKAEIPQPKPTPQPAPTPVAPEAKQLSVEAAVPEAEQYVEPAPESLYLRLKTQLGRTRAGLGGILSHLQIGQKAINKDLLEEIEDSLLMADVGIDVTTKVIGSLSQKLERQQLNDSGALMSGLKQELLGIIAPCSQPLVIPKKDGPFVILVVGVNGVGKTTTIGKLAKRLKAQGNSVMLAAGDTFRAAAVEQLQTWGERNNITVIAQHTGADSASVIYDGVQSAKAKGVDVLIADTAGRLHTKDNLMEELKKVKRIMAKLDETAPHEVLLVLDAGTGQNALSQAKQFNEAVSLTGLALTKLDGTAKGGVIFALAKQSGIPIRFIGVGEGIDDLQDFNAEKFIDALFVSE